MIYIACPGNFATGGTELLHQLSHNLTRFTNDVRMFYYAGDQITHERFKDYHVSIADAIDDDENNVLIIPEVATPLLQEYKHVKKVIWWLSVDNYYSIFKIRTDELYDSIRRNLKKLYKRESFLSHKVDFKDNDLVHCVQSQYAKEFLESKGVRNIHFLSDYLNKTYIEGSTEEGERLDQILYNPKKGFGFTKKIMEQCPEYTFIPLENLTPDEVATLCKRSKVYIDFGTHPGKDRFPREAAILGCVVLVGKRGSAVNQVDIPIDDAYKFALRNSSIPSIRKKIQEIFQNFEEEQKQFETYRERISSDRTIFDQELDSLYQKLLCMYV